MNLDKRTIIGILLIVAIMVVWGITTMPSKEERAREKARQQHIKDSTEQANREKEIQDSIDLAQANLPDTTQYVDTNITNLPDSLQQIAMDSIDNKQADDLFGPFASNAVGEEEQIIVETEKFVLTFSNLGGMIARAQMVEFQTYHSRFEDKNQDTLDLWISGETGYTMSMAVTGNRIVETATMFFETDASSTKISGDQSATVSYKAYANNDSSKYVEFVYIIKGNDYMIDFNINFVNLEQVIEPNLLVIPFTWTMTTPSQEHQIKKERENSNIYYSDLDGNVKQMKGGVKGNKKDIDKQLKWISYKQQFFSTTLIAKDGFLEKPFKMATKNGESNDALRNKLYTTEINLPYQYNPREMVAMSMYMGPNHRKTLAGYDIAMEDQINIGSFFLIEWINKGVIVVFNGFANMGMKYGIIILMLTLIIKLITMPLTYRTFVSSAKMRILKPEVDALNEKFKKEEAMQKQQAVMQLYRRAGVSPLSGCIPALLQMPILFAMIAFFPGAFELRQEGLLWADDLSTYDSILQLPFNIPAYGDHVSLFALLMTITTIFYTKLNSGQMTASGGMQAQQMKIMMYLMPVVFLIFLNNYSAALSYYYFLSNLISIGLMLFIRKFMINEDKLLAQIEEKKKKTPKKSKWMARMEEIQKSRQEQLRQQQKGGKGKKR